MRVGIGLATGRFGRSFPVSGLVILVTVWSGVLTPGKTEKTGLSTGLFASYVIENRSHFFIIFLFNNKSIFEIEENKL